MGQDMEPCVLPRSPPVTSDGSHHGIRMHRATHESIAALIKTTVGDVVTVDPETGRVFIPDGMSLDEASRRFLLGLEATATRRNGDRQKTETICRELEERFRSLTEEFQESIARMADLRTLIDRMTGRSNGT